MLHPALRTHDILDLVLDFADADTHRLSAYSLVHPTWRGPSQKRIFRTVYVDGSQRGGDERAWRKLLPLLETSAYLRPYIKTLMVFSGRIPVTCLTEYNLAQLFPAVTP
jgi:hypothetical protein